MVSRADFLATVEIFSDLSPTALRAVSEYLSERHLSAGEVLFNQGDPGDAMYIVQTGGISVSVISDADEEIVVATFTPGDFLGEMSIFQHEPRSATCQAVTDATVLRLREEDFAALIKSRPDDAIGIMQGILRIITGRLDETSALLSDMVQWGEEARRRAFTDELTGLYNRRFLDDALAEHVAVAVSSGEPLCLVMMDLDHFTAINEEFGREVADQLIAAVAPAIQATFREHDILARYGGDEFTFLLPKTNAKTALELCGSLRQAVSDIDFLETQPGTITSVTASQGIACFPDHGTTVSDLRAAADRALYRAKELGRNCAAIADTITDNVETGPGGD